MKKKQLAVSALLLVLLLVACVPKAAPAPAPQMPAPQAPAPAKPAPVAAAPAKPAWEVEWDKTVEAAKKEGTVTLHTTIGPLTRTEVGRAFQSRFDIRSEWVGGASRELTARILAERRAGIYSADATIIGYSAPYLILKPAGAVQSLDKLLFLPDLSDPQEIQKVWRFGLEWVDKDHTTLKFASTLNVSVVVNTQLVQPGEIKGFRDLLAPKWKGKMVLHDPTVGAGPGPNLIQGLGDYLFGWDFVRQLAEQKPVLTTDARLQMTWLAQGKYPIALGTRPEALKEFLDLGAPVKMLLMEEGELKGASASAIAAMTPSPHPNAAKLFINWLLSKEGQTVYSNSYNVPSNRLDVPIEGVYPIMVPDPKKKYVDSDSEEWILGMPEAQKKAKEIFAKLKG